MKKISYLLYISILCSCTSLKTDNIAPGYSQAFKSIKEAILGHDYNLDPNIIANIPYASMIVKIGKGPSALMILESINENEYTWVSSDGVYLVLKEGKVIKTQGLPNNLYKTTSSISLKEVIDSDAEYVSYISFRNPDLNNLKVVSKYTSNKTSKEQLTFESKELLHVTEKVTSPIVGCDENNSYWLDKNYFVWKSVQHISPRLPPIYIEVTKKPR